MSDDRNFQADTSDSVLKQVDPPKEHVLFEGMARVYDKTEADEYIDALREQITKLTLLSDSQLANQERLTEELEKVREELRVTEKLECEIHVALEAAGCPHSEKIGGERHSRWLNSRKRIAWLAAELATERANQERLATSLIAIVTALGITDGTIPLTGPQVTLLADDAKHYCERLVGEKWIDCKQELPPDDKHVLVWQNFFAPRVSLARYWGKDLGWHMSAVTGNVNAYVTYWMPMLDPPASLAPKDTPEEK